MEIQPYNASVIGASQMAVLVNASNFCFQIGNFQPTDQQRSAAIDLPACLTLTLTLTLSL